MTECLSPDALFPSGQEPVRGVIFDMDGLLLDSETLAMEALVLAGADLGHDVSMSFCRMMIGVPADGCRRLVREAWGGDFPIDRFFALQEVHLRHLVDTGRLALKKGVEPLLDLLDRLELPRAIATSSSRLRTDHHLKLVGLFDRFDAIVTRDDVTAGKPDPEPYLTAAARIGIPPDYCLALEDSHSGARAAHAAGIRVIVVPDLLDATDEIRGKALAVVEDLTIVRTYIEHAAAL
ncbi:HAD family hydrolase [Acetobacter oeni]|uniref:Hydrolase n=1 Tax=Acetobacter oeni TaxID=304077 RepID=A0A511XMB7_9PROT|nr:HAD family phosphatase [Acetobacter oeni]MBB3884086.1 HAD superfamily hydrolase (TIGR01509 family) [Acetobacter oeni]NHO20091.1 HAD-IA family hydrolase [Acetobacter oeni]GBR02525.1 phosphatase/phosphohexomutase [Acetobacter oeni LMG 21952]GEN64071.1 hydrolase [Acetobacter oeni]